MTRRVVITSWGSYGDIYPYVGLARILAQRGYRALLAVPEFYRSLIEGENLEFYPVGPAIDPSDRATIARFMHPTTGAEALVRDLLMPALRQTYADLLEAARGTDLLVSHPATFAAPVLAQKKGLPWVSTVLAPMSFFSATDLPVFPPAPRLIHLRRLGPWFGRMMVRLVRRATRSWMDPLYRLRAELGLPRDGDPIYEGQFSSTLTLALFSRILAAPQRDWPINVRTTGFVFYNGPESLTPEIESFLSSGAPPIVFTLGTSAVGAAGTFYEESVAAAARLGMRALLLTGGYPENVPREARSADVLAVDRAPHQLLFPRARVIVHQGGVGTTGQALRAGRPMLVVPYAFDQPDNAFRVTTLGVARTLFPRQYRAPRVAHELGRLLNNPRYEYRATEVAAMVLAEKGADEAAEALSSVGG